MLDFGCANKTSFSHLIYFGNLKVWTVLTFIPDTSPLEFILELHLNVNCFLFYKVPPKRYAINST